MPVSGENDIECLAEPLSENGKSTVPRSDDLVRSGSFLNDLVNDRCLFF